MATTSGLNLAKVFQTVSTTLLENKDALNQADTLNSDHGDNMVKIFTLATQAIKQKKGATPAEQMAYAGQEVQSKLSSGSSKVYAEGFMRAAQSVQGKKQLSQEDAMQLIQMLMGTGQAAQPAAPAPQPEAGDALGSLLGGLLGGAQPNPAAGGGMDLGSLLSVGAELLGGQPAQQQQPEKPGGLDINNLVSAGLAFMRSRQQGESTAEALLDALVAGTQASNSPARAQSSKLVAGTLLQAFGAMLK